MSKASPKNQAPTHNLDELLRFIVGITLALTLVVIVGTVLYSLVFITQPMNGQSPNDAEFFKLITPMATFITGCLSGIMVGSSGRKNAPADDPPPASE